MSALTVDPVPGHGQDWDDLVRNLEPHRAEVVSL